MSGKTGIEWTEMTWNPVVGCTRVSSGCDHCYAFQLHDQRHIAWKRGRWPTAPAQYHQPFSKVQLLPERLDDPLRWRKPRRVFVNSLSDLFHPDVPDAYIARVFAVMAEARRHTFQVLTKRPDRMAHLITQWYTPQAGAPAAGPAGGPAGPLPNVWLGVSVEDQAAADERIPLLLQTPARIRFLSCEPLLGSLNLVDYLQLTDANQMTDERWETHGWGYDRNTGGFMGVAPRGSIPYNPRPGLDWVIIGGESGHHARAMDMAWAQSLVEQCAAAGIAVFMKQLGSVAAKRLGLRDRHGGDPSEWSDNTLLAPLCQREWPASNAAADAAADAAAAADADPGLQVASADIPAIPARPAPGSVSGSVS